MDATLPAFADLGLRTRCGRDGAFNGNHPLAAAWQRFGAPLDDCNALGSTRRQGSGRGNDSG